MFRSTTLRTNRGFSLVELVVVVTITAILAAVAVPKISHGLSAQGLRTAAQRVASDLAYARTMARNRGRATEVHFSTGTTQYSMPGTPSPNGDSEYLVDLADTPNPAQIEAVDFGGEAFVSFDLYGVPSSGGSISLSSGSSTKTLTVNATTGQVTIQ